MHRLSDLTRLVSQPSPVHAVELVALFVLVAVGARVAARIEISKVVVVGIGLEVFSGNWKYIPLPLPVDRALLALAAVLLLLRGTKWSQRRIVAQPVHFLLLGTAAYVLANGLAAGTIDHSYGLYAWLDRLGVVPFVMYTLAPVLFGTRRQRNLLLVAMVVVGVYLGIEGLAEGVGVRALELPGYIRDQAIGITAGRTRGPFLASDAMGIALFDCGVFAAIALTQWRRPAARYICWAVITMAAAGIFFTLTRSVWLGAIIAIAAAMLWHPRLRRLIPATLAGGGVAVVALLLLVPGLSAKVHGRVSTTSSVWDRYNTNHAAIRALDAHPLFGLGWQTFASKGPDYLREAAHYPLSGVGLEVHNVFLSHFAELGLFGGLLWAFALCAAVGGAIVRRGDPELWIWRVGLLALALLFVTVANLGPLSYALPNVLLWLVAGIAARDRNSTPRIGGTAVGGDQAAFELVGS